ncbi:AAA family ATPase [Mycobacterium sp. 852002-51057_SCH5723018]|uniref:AAA family ATPase n=1 Tax=Mycobacterium sp. 852002-51057_SCH5723018 TaxID=1834094 RepID=UPI000801A54E|nr:AAA family ATPase [Mycobacterium sp. 852002-51057_SCH5723018]OBG28556.1 hypothetical protein A5764_25250 [Mycobacterium sp. 852002-51057_SCH5723018]
MSDGAVLPRGVPARGETVSETPRARVTRNFEPAGTVIRKKILGADAERRVHHEVAVLGRLRGVTGVAQLLDEARHPGSITIADAGHTSLAQAVKPLAIDDLIGLAAALAKAVAGMHDRGVLHRDICPANIVIDSHGAPCLVSFRSAMALAEVRPEFTHHTNIVGTLAYLAPEQTGRTGRPVDQRADLYALGATLYELATGEPPFGRDDPLRLTHDHLARVPAAPSDLNPAVPQQLSSIILHLLEKEPDDRYQSAEGLLYDLQQLRAPSVSGTDAPQVGERDFPRRLLPPSRLVGRDDEVAALTAAFDDALRGGCSGVLVSGPPGVGKTALVDQLRAVVTGNDGWFVVGKFDQYRRDLEFDGISQAFRALGRLLLAEPEDELAQIRERMLAALGPNAGMAAAAVPEMAALLGVAPEAGDPLTAQLRAQRSAVDTLRAVASPKRPLVVFVDDLQWAGATPVAVINQVFGEQVEGLLLVAAYRDELDAAHPLAVSLSRWRQQQRVTHVDLPNLAGSSLAALVAEILRADRAAVGTLAELIEPHTRGNPYETVELLCKLRHQGMLSPTSTGWRWDEPVVRSFLARSGVAELPMARLAALPTSSRDIVEVMACLGGRAEVSVLAAATAQSVDVVEERLAPALAESVLVADSGAHDMVRFRHDRIRETILADVDDTRRRRTHLALARRLAATPELFAVAAEQYLPVLDAVSEAAERSQVVALLRRAAEQAAVVAGYSQVHTLLAGALRVADASDTATLMGLHTGRHAALFCLGRLDEADEDYRTLERLCTASLQRLDATCVQVLSLTNRKLFAEAIELGLNALRELGIEVPAVDQHLPAVLDRQFDSLYRWLNNSDVADDVGRPDITDPKLLAVARLLNAVFPTMFLVGDALQGWVSLEAIRIWVEHGTARSALGPASYSAFVTIALRDDYSAAYRTLRRFVTVGEARGYEPETSQVRYLFSHLSCWFEPIEFGVQQGEWARQGLVAGGDLATAGYAFHTTGGQLDCVPTLKTYVAEAEAALAFVQRVGSEHTGQWLAAYRRLAGELLGEGSARAGPAGPGPLDVTADSPVAVFFSHLSRAIAAAIFDDAVESTQQTAAAMQLLPAVVGLYASAVARLLRGLALAQAARSGSGEEQAAQLSELEGLTRWLAARAADAPMNFLHLLRLLEAERAWAVGDFRAAALAFDAARSQAAARQRPWHQALIAERAARFYLAHGLQQAGFELLAQARQAYLSWGATAKADHLDWAYPALRPEVDVAGGDDAQSGAFRRQDPGVTTGTIDLLGILSASRALSSETSIERLHARVVEVLQAMTGATGVRLLIWSDHHQDWLLPTAAGTTTLLSGTGHQDAVPMSALRFVQRAPEPLVVTDATTDDRFARDSYFADVDRCSLLVLPILGRGRLRAVLLLENRLIRGAFTAERLDAVKLIAGQLAVSLDNAQLYMELAASRARIVAAADQARRRIERDLHDGAQQQLVSLAMQLRMMHEEAALEADDLRIQLDRAATQANGALDLLRDLSRGIHPAVLTKGGLRPALHALIRRSPIPVQLELDVNNRLPDPIETSAYYIVAEALTNAAKHSRASAVTLTVDEQPAGFLRLEVCDDGIGGADFTRGTGLVGLKDRAEALGGHINLRSAHGDGTTLHVELPLTRASA